MAIPTFTPYKAPVVGKQTQVTFRTLDAGFGDGYSQVTGDGLNARQETAKSLSWVGMTQTQCNSITSQLDTYAGTTFAYQLPTDAASLYWRCKTYTLDDSDAAFLRLVADFVQVFDLS